MFLQSFYEPAVSCLLSGAARVHNSSPPPPTLLLSHSLLTHQRAAWQLSSVSLSAGAALMSDADRTHCRPPDGYLSCRDLNGRPKPDPEGFGHYRGGGTSNTVNG